MHQPAHGPPRRRGRRAAAAVALLGAAAAGWTAWQLLQGASDLRSAAADLQAAQAALTAGEPWTSSLSTAAEQARSGRDHLDDPLVAAASSLPLLGTPVRTARGLADAAVLIVDEALLPLAAPLGDRPARRLVPAPGTVDLDVLGQLGPPAERAATGLAAAVRAVRGTPERSRVAPLDDARAELADGLAGLQSAVDGLRTAVRVGPEALGAGTVRRYLVLSQSPSEARGTGGLLGGYTLLEARDGRLTVVRSGGRGELQSPGTPVIDLGPEFTEHHGVDGATYGWINANLGPHVPDFGRIASALWERQFGEVLDGVVLVDPLGLSLLMQATGPVTLPDGSSVSSAAVADLTLRDVYARFPGLTVEDEVARNALLQAVSTSVTDALLSRDVPPRALVTAVGEAVEQRRIKAWSALPTVQAELEGSIAGGTLPRGRAVGDVVADSTGSKLTYYLARELRYEQGCGTATSRLSLTLHNTAPETGLPEYVTPPSLREGLPPGTVKVLTTLYLPEGSTVDDVLVDEAPAGRRTGTERGLTWVATLVEVLPGQRRTVAVDFAEPDSDEPLQRVVQPLVQPEVFTTSGC